MKTTLIASFCLLCVSAWSQPGKVVLQYNRPQTEALMARYVVINKKNETTTGWRVQVFASNDRLKMDEVLAAFKIRFPDVYADWKHQQPYYKVYAGAFSRKFDAWLLLQRVRTVYPSAFLAQDSQIRISELLRS
jgi:hypothetical protein